MSLAHKLSTPAKPIFIDAPKCYMCTLTDADASARWASWFDQAEGAGVAEPCAAQEHEGEHHFHKHRAPELSAQDGMDAGQDAEGARQVAR